MMPDWTRGDGGFWKRNPTLAVLAEEVCGQWIDETVSEADLVLEAHEDARQRAVDQLEVAELEELFLRCGGRE